MAQIAMPPSAFPLSPAAVSRRRVQLLQALAGAAPMPEPDELTTRALRHLVRDGLAEVSCTGRHPYLTDAGWAEVQAASR